MRDTAIISTRKGEEIVVPSKYRDELSKYNWYLSAHGYAVRVVVRCSRSEARETGKTRLGSEFIHRLILGMDRGEPLSKDEHVDHIDRNPLNNSIDNLRIVSARGYENASNHGVRKDNSTGVKGVHWHSRDNVYYARIQHKGERHSLGYFNTLKDATMAYNKAAEKLHGEYAYINGGAA